MVTTTTKIKRYYSRPGWTKKEHRAYTTNLLNPYWGKDRMQQPT